MTFQRNLITFIADLSHWPKYQCSELPYCFLKNGTRQKHALSGKTPSFCLFEWHEFMLAYLSCPRAPGSRSDRWPFPDIGSISPRILHADAGCTTVFQLPALLKIIVLLYWFRNMKLQGFFVMSCILYFKNRYYIFFKLLALDPPSNLAKCLVEILVQAAHKLYLYHFHDRW